MYRGQDFIRGLRVKVKGRKAATIRLHPGMQLAFTPQSTTLLDPNRNISYTFPDQAIEEMQLWVVDTRYAHYYMRVIELGEDL